MDPLTKTWFSLGLPVVALFNFWTAMRVFGKKPPVTHAKLFMRLHRIGGYVFLLYFATVSWICFDLMARLAAAGRPLDVRGFYHGMLSFTLLLLKLSFIRFFRRFVPQGAITIGLIPTVGTMVDCRIDVFDPAGIGRTRRRAMAAIIVICLATITGFMLAVVYLLNTPPEEDSDEDGA